MPRILFAFDALPASDSILSSEFIGRFFRKAHLSAHSVYEHVDKEWVRVHSEPTTGGMVLVSDQELSPPVIAHHQKWDKREP